MRTTLLLFVVLFLSQSCFLFSQQSWVWQNPKPQGSNILASYFLDANNGWAVGNNGTCIKTIDGGETWSDIHLPINNNLCSVRFLNPDTGYVGDWNGDVIKTTDGGTTWDVQHLDNYADVYIFFIDQNYGWILSSASPSATYKLYRTTNGGADWQSNLINTTYILNDLYFIDSSKGFVVGGFGSILMTSDGGINWSYINSPVTDFLYKVTFKNNTEGFIGGSNGTLLKTFDGGVNWQYNTVGPYTIWDISFINNSKGILVENDSRIYTSSDGGNTWSEKTFSSIWSLRSCKYLTNSNCLILGQLGNIYKSYNNGNNWTYKVLGSRNNLNDIKFINNGIGYVVGDNGTILKTTNYGQVWETLSSPTSESLNSISFPGNHHGYIVGDNSVFLKTVDGGENWTCGSIPNNYDLTTSFFLNDNIGWVAGLYNKILKTTDAGNTWILQNINETELININSLEMVNEETGYACGNYSSYFPPKSFILKTTNGGSNWNIIKTQILSEFESVFFIDSENGWVVDHLNSNTLHTTNGGNNWDTVGVSGNYIYFWNDLYGIVLDYHAVGNDVYLTSDGGNNWILKPNFVDRYLYSAYIDINGIWIAGMYGTILHHDFSILPVELNSFSANLDNGNVILTWQTSTETNSHGFEIERSLDKISWITIGFIEGKGTTTEPQQYSYSDNRSDMSASEIYYRLKQIDFNGSFEYSDVIGVMITPSTFSLEQNYPNPFNPNTAITYQIPTEQFVTLKVYDVLGSEVATLVNEEKPAGSYELNFPATGGASKLASGVYYYQLRAGSFIVTKKMILVK